MTNRIDTITDFFNHLIVDELGQAIATPDKETWDGYPLSPEHRWGWMPPLPYDTTVGPLLLLTVCPEIIAEHTAHCADDEVRGYLDAIGLLLTIHVAEYEPPGKGPSVRERTELAEAELTEACPELMDLMSRIQLHALDALAAG